VLSGSVPHAAPPAARLPVGKSLDSFDFEAVSMVSKAQVVALTTGDSFNATMARRTLVASCAAQGPATYRCIRNRKPFW
jgi:hypothetical protein